MFLVSAITLNLYNLLNGIIMKTKALFLVVLLCTSITSALTGCSDEQIEPKTQQKQKKVNLRFMPVLKNRIAGWPWKVWN